MGGPGETKRGPEEAQVGQVHQGDAFGVVFCNTKTTPRTGDRSIHFDAFLTQNQSVRVGGGLTNKHAVRSRQTA